MADALKINTTLEVFNIYGNNRIGDVGAAALADALAVNSSLRVLWVNSCGIGAVGWRAIADALKTNSSLESLVMANNKIGDAGASASTDALATATTTSLKELCLCNCDIGDEGALALGRAWGRNLALSMDLDLRTTYDEHNPIRDEAERVRAFLLQSSP